jgi:hypothetical protein
LAAMVAERAAPAPGYADWLLCGPGYAAGGLVGVPHSAQNLALALRLALQFVQCFCVGVPHSAQNLAPTWTGLWQLPHGTVAAAGAGAGAAAGGWAAAGCGAGCCA